jgi:hypothetical protein
VADPALVHATAEQALGQDAVRGVLPPDAATRVAPVHAARGS